MQPWNVKTKWVSFCFFYLFHGINGTVGIALEILDHLQDASTTKALEWFGIRMLLPNLGQMQRVPEGVLHLLDHQRLRVAHVQIRALAQRQPANGLGFDSGEP